MGLHRTTTALVPNWVPTRIHVEPVGAPEGRAAHPPGITHAVLIYRPEPRSAPVP